MSGINMETIKTLEMINMLVQKAKNGVKPFSEATLENMDNYIFYDEKAETENGFPIVHGMIVDEDHHDVLSTLDQYINSEDEYTVRVRFDEDDYMYIEFQLDDGIIEIDENGWIRNVNNHPLLSISYTKCVFCVKCVKNIIATNDDM